MSRFVRDLRQVLSLFAVFFLAIACGENPTRTFRGHASEILAIAISPDGREFVSGSADGQIIQWSAVTGQVLRTLGGSGGSVRSLAYSPDGKLVLSGGDDRMVRLWNSRTGEAYGLLGGDHGAINAVAFSPDGRHAFSAGFEEPLTIWDVESGQSIAQMDAGTFGIAVSADGKVLSSHFGSLKVADRQTAAEMKQIATPNAMIMALAIFGDGSRAFAAGKDGAIGLWNLTTDQCERTYVGHKGPVTSLALSPTERTLVSSSSDGTVRVWNVESGKEMRRIRAHSRGAGCVAFSPDGAAVYSGGYDRMVKMWSILGDGARVAPPVEIAQATATTPVPPAKETVPALVGRMAELIPPDASAALKSSTPADSQAIEAAAAPTPADETPSPAPDEIPNTPNESPIDEQPIGELKIFEGHDQAVRSVAFSSDGKRALSAGGATIRIWNLETGESIHAMACQGGVINSASFSPDGLRILSGGDDKLLRLWNAETGAPMLTLPAGKEHKISIVSWSADGTQALTGGSDFTIRLWDFQEGRLTQIFSGHTEGVLGAAFSPDGRRIISGSLDGSVRLWYAFTGQQVRRFGIGQNDPSSGENESQEEIGFVWSVAFSPDGHRALTASSDKSMRLWDVESGLELGKLQGPERLARCVTFSPDGLRALSGGSDGAVRLWDVENTREITVFEGHTDLALSVAFSPDGRRALSGSVDKTMRLWGLPR